MLRIWVEMNKPHGIIVIGTNSRRYIKPISQKNKKIAVTE